MLKANNPARWGTAILIVLAAQAAAWAGGSTAGSTISNRATVSWTVSGSTQDTNTAYVDSTVGKISSDTLTAATDQNGSVGESKVFTYSIYNTGNRADTFNVSVDSFTMNGGAASWAFALYVGGSITSVEDDTKTTASIAADGVGTCSVVVWINSTPANSPNGSFADFRLVITPGNLANADTTGQYTGDNGVSYALGTAGSNDVARATVQSAVMGLVKSIPSVTMGGIASLPLPGATIVYELTYNNSGSDTADSVVIRDTVVTTYLTFDTMSRSGSALGGTATFVTDSGITGWLAQVTTNASPSNAYTSVDWINADTWDGTGVIANVRWIKQEVAPAETATMRFRAFIK